MYYVFCDGQMGGVAWDEDMAVRTCAALTVLHPERTYGYCPVLLWDAEMERLELGGKGCEPINWRMRSNTR